MIDSRELRIGNIVTVDGEQRIVTLGLLFAIDKCVCMPQGTPIGPDILEKCNAVNKYGCTWFIGKLKFTYEHNELSRFVGFHYSGKVVYLQYLHELQNLCYALKTELTITL